MLSPSPSGYTISSHTREGKIFMVLLCFVALIGLAAAFYYFEDKRHDDPLTDTVSIATKIESMSGELDLTRVESYRNGAIEVATAQEMPGRIAEKLRTQSRLFQSVIEAAELIQNGGVTNEEADTWKAVKARFPDQVYFSRPSGGSYEVGTREYIEANHGKSNTMSMSHSLYSTFLDIIDKADPNSLEKTFKELDEKTVAEINARDFDTIKARSRDAFTLPRAHADRTWLELLKKYTTEARAETLSQGQGPRTSQDVHAMNLAKWEAFNKENGATLAEWFETQTTGKQQFNQANLRITTDGYPVAKIPFGGQFLYVTPDTTPANITFTLTP